MLFAGVTISRRSECQFVVTNSSYVPNVSVLLRSWNLPNASYLHRSYFNLRKLPKTYKGKSTAGLQQLVFLPYGFDRLFFNDFVAVGRNLYSVSSCHKTTSLLAFIPVCVGLWANESVQFVNALTKLLAYSPSDFQAKAVRQVQLLSSESLQFDISMQFFFPEKKASIQNILSDWISVVQSFPLCVRSALSESIC